MRHLEGGVRNLDYAIVAAVGRRAARHRASRAALAAVARRESVAPGDLDLAVRRAAIVWFATAGLALLTFFLVLILTASLIGREALDALAVRTILSLLLSLFILASCCFATAVVRSMNANEPLLNRRAKRLGTTVPSSAIPKPYDFLVACAIAVAAFPFCLRALAG
jgi:hypothetical protein